MSRGSYKEFRSPVDNRRLHAAIDGEGSDATATRLRQLLLQSHDLSEIGKLDISHQRRRLEHLLNGIIASERLVLSDRERTAIVRRVIDEAVGLGVLEPLLTDKTVSEIMINGHDSIYVEREGNIEKVPLRFTSDEQLRRTIERIVSTVNRRVDESSPMVDARIPPNDRMTRAARVNVILPPLCLNGPTVTIRLFPEGHSLEDLLKLRSLDQPTVELLAACVRARLNVIISGGTASGKTTLLNALSASIPDDQRIVTIEDAAELSLQQEHTVRLETRPANIEGQGAISIRDLVRNALRMRPDRIIVGEVRGGEALDMLQAMHTGHEGSLATIHANSPVDALSRLKTLAAMSDLPIPSYAIDEQVYRGVDLIVQLERRSDGTRRIVEIGYVVVAEHDKYRLAPILTHTAGVLRRHPLPSDLVDRLREKDEAPPPDFETGPPD